MLQPGEVQEALDRMRAGEGAPEVFKTIMAGAEGFAALTHEYVFKSLVPGAVFATQNDMLAEMMQVAKPNEQMLLRLAPPLPEWLATDRGDRSQMPERKPKRAWSSVDDPNPRFPKCDRCEAFARWAVGEVGNECTFADVTVRYFACGSHINRVLVDADWLLGTLCAYDLSYPPERA